MNLFSLAALSALASLPAAVPNVFETPVMIQGGKAPVAVENCERWLGNLQTLPENTNWFLQQSRPSKPLKNEFETSAQFDERLRTWERTTRVWLNASFEVDPDDFTYAADRGVLIITPQNYLLGGASQVSDKGSYVGTNAFGVSRKVTGSVTLYKSISVEGSKHVMPFGRELSMDSATAADFEQTGRIHVLGYLDDTEATMASSVPTVARPRDDSTVRKIYKIIPACFAAIHKGEPVKGLQWYFDPNAPLVRAVLKPEATKQMEESLSGYLWRYSSGGSASWSVQVNEFGQGSSCRIINSSFGKEQDEAICERIMRNARFKPAQINGVPVASEFRSSFKFSNP